jgi:hypothetical protein
MHNTLQPKPHGVIDYVVDAVFLLAPSIFNFSPAAATLAYVVAGVHFLMNIFTRYPMGLVKVIPFPIHGTMELIASIVLVLAPNLFGFTTDVNATWFFRISGVAVFGVWSLTNYRSSQISNAIERPTLRAA